MDHRSPQAYSPLLPHQEHFPQSHNQSPPKPFTSIIIREKINEPSTFFTSKLSDPKTRMKLFIIGVLLIGTGIIFSVLLPIITATDAKELDTWANDPHREIGDTIVLRGKINKGPPSFGTTTYKFTDAEETFTCEWNMANDGETVILKIKYEDWSSSTAKPVLSVVRLDTLFSIYSIPVVIAIVGLICLVPPIGYTVFVLLGADRGKVKERYTILPVPEEGQKPATQHQIYPPTTQHYPSSPAQLPYHDPMYQRPQDTDQHYLASSAQSQQPGQTPQQVSQSTEASEERQEDVFLLDPSEREDVHQESKTAGKRKKTKSGGPF